ncbi:MAG TPA: hypothetical protein VD736_04800 [Nitrososphaera sp.]|nr:hypothetical protein [Nitrososphaera sp.]
MDVHITQFNVQLYFRQPLDTEKLNSAFSESEGFAASQMQQGNHPMQDTMSFFRQGFRIAPVQSNVLPFRILQVMSYPNALQNPDQETISCLHYVATSLKQHLNVDIDNDIYAVRVVFHSIIQGRGDMHRILTKLDRIDSIPTLAGKYVGHKNPMDAIQLTSKTGSGLSHKFWNDMRISQFDTHSYVVTIFNETDSLAASLDFVRGVKQFVATLMQEMEQAAAGT